MTIAIVFKCKCGAEHPLKFKRPTLLRPAIVNVKCEPCDSISMVKFQLPKDKGRPKDEMDGTVICRVPRKVPT